MFRMMAIVLLGVTVLALSSGCSTTVPVTADAITFHASNSWVPESTTHSSRKLQFRVPSDEPGVADARVVVWNFPGVRDSGDGRVIQANMDRWSTQFAQDDGMPSDGLALRAEYRVSGMPVYTFNISGSYTATDEADSGLQVIRPAYRMRGAYIVSPQGDYIVKFVGPVDVVDRHGAEFDTFVKTARSRHWFAPPQEAQDEGRRSMLTATPATP